MVNSFLALLALAVGRNPNFYFPGVLCSPVLYGLIILKGVSNFLGHPLKKNSYLEIFFTPCHRISEPERYRIAPRFADRVAALSLYYRAAFPHVFQQMDTDYTLDDSDCEVDKS